MKSINRTKIWVIDGMRVCTATHPDHPNFSGHSRGRKIHLEDLTGKFQERRVDKKEYTRCGLLCDEGIPDNDKNWSVVSNGKCVQCFKGIVGAK